MAFGEKLGKVFGAIGSGLSFVPGPWSAVGFALGAAGQAASMADKIKQQKEQERLMQEQEQPQQPMQEPQDRSRPQQAQIAPQNNEAPTQLPQPSMNAPIYQGQPNLGGYSQQLEIQNILAQGGGFDG